ncbi:methyltransferase LaeA [Metarhizium brunneum]
MEPPMEFDIESDWKPMERNWDLIHVRTLFGAVRCWEDIYRKIHRHLKPNVGYLEQVEIDWEPRFKGGNIPYKCALVDWTDKLLRAMDRHGRSMRVEPERTRRQLRTAGFSDIHDCSIRVGFTPWSEDRHERDVALWFGAGFSRAIKALSYGPMSLYLTMSIKDIDLLCEAVLDDLRTARYKAYCRIKALLITNRLEADHTSFFVGADRLIPPPLKTPVHRQPPMLNC